MNSRFSNNHINDSIDFRLIESRPGITMILLSDIPFYTIIAVSNDFVTTSGRAREEVCGKSHFSIFPENPAEPSSSGVNSLKNSFDYILEYKTVHSLPKTRYDIPDGKGGFLEKYWKINNAPVFNQRGEIDYIIHTSEEVTAQVRAEKKEEEHKELRQAYQKVEESNKDFQFVTDFMPQMIWVTRPDGYHYYYNKQWYDYTGLTYRDTKGEGLECRVSS